MADAGEAAPPAPRRLTVFGALAEGWESQPASREAIDALAQLYPVVELTPAEVKRMEKAKKFLEKKQKAAAAPASVSDQRTFTHSTLDTPSLSLSLSLCAFRLCRGTWEVGTLRRRTGLDSLAWSHAVTPCSASPQRGQRPSPVAALNGGRREREREGAEELGVLHSPLVSLTRTTHLLGEYRSTSRLSRVEHLPTHCSASVHRNQTSTFLPVTTFSIVATG